MSLRVVDVSQLSQDARKYSLYNFGMDRIENMASNNSPIVALVSIAVDMCLLCRCLTMAEFTYSTNPAFQPSRYNIKVHDQ
jgi:hypothetical protein